MLCDWGAAVFGGYGMTQDCGNGTSISSKANQAECVAGLPATCPVTVSQFESCARMVSCVNPLPTPCLSLAQCS
jgi:hypothetical protein